MVSWSLTPLLVWTEYFSRIVLTQLKYSYQNVYFEILPETLREIRLLNVTFLSLFPKISRYLFLSLKYYSLAQKRYIKRPPLFQDVK